jgi:hypothetical protein
VVTSAGAVPDLDGYRRIAERFNVAGETAKKQGFDSATITTTSSSRPSVENAPTTCSSKRPIRSYVCFEMDLYWITKAGEDPLRYFTRWPGRIELVHVKDADPALPHRMADVGAGMLDWRSLLGHGTQAGVKHFFVEQDEAPDPFASITASYAYLRDLRF